jgi:tetratricopeptide (TPR) repeat protein
MTSTFEIYSIDFTYRTLVASEFGKKKLNISPSRSSVQVDVEILQLFGPSRRDDVHLGLAKKLEGFIANISKKIETDASYEHASTPILEAICRAYNPGWILLARWHMENGKYVQAKEELRRFLENTPPKNEAAKAWELLGRSCRQTDDLLGEIHALIERAQISIVPFNDISSTANRLNNILRHDDVINKDQKDAFARRIALVLEKRREEASGGDYSRMAWLQLNLQQESKAREYAKCGLELDPSNAHCKKIIEKLDRNL